MERIRKQFSAYFVTDINHMTHRYKVITPRSIRATEQNYGIFFSPSDLDNIFQKRYEFLYKMKKKNSK